MERNMRMKEKYTISSTKASFIDDFLYSSTRKTKAIMIKKQSSPPSSYRFRFTAKIASALLVLSLCSTLCIVRYTSQLTMESMATEQAASHQPPQLSSRTIRIAPENQQRTASTDIYISHRRNLAHRNRIVEKEQHRHYRYKLGLVRLLGNPIPPREDKNQTLWNLELLLEHEPKFETTVDKHWIVNRIADDDFLQQITRTLRKHNQTFSVVSFDIRQYESTPYRYEKASKKIMGSNFSNSEVDLLRSRSFWDTHGDKDSKKVKEQQRSFYVDELYKDKNLYVTNRNNARNFALDLYTGKKKKKKTRFMVDYVLPWDGDCFLSQSAHDSLHRDLEQHNDEQQQRIAAARTRLRKEMRADNDATDRTDADDDFIDNEIGKLMKIDSLSDLLNTPIKYFYTPKEQAEKSNETVIDRFEDGNKYKPMANEEQPQLVLHRTAKTRFDRNGINKVYMLQILQIKGPWIKGSKTYPLPNDYNYHPYIFIDDNNNSLGAPVVGWVTGLISSGSNLGTLGVTSQKEGLALLCRSLDVRAVNQIHYKIDVNNHKPKWKDLPYLFYDETVLKKEASVYKKNKEAKVSESPPSFDGLVRQLINVADSLTKHGTTYSKTSMFSRRSVSTFQSDSTVLGLAYELTGEVKYAKQAAENIRSWFLNPDTRWNGPTADCFLESSVVLRPELGVAEIEDVSALGLAFEWTGDAKYAKEAAENIRSWFVNPDTRAFADSVPRPDLNVTDFEDATALGLAYKSTGDSKYAKEAADKSSSWFLKPERTQLTIVDFKDVSAFLDEVTVVVTTSNEVLSENDYVSKFNAMDFKDVYFFLDTVKMVAKSGELSESEIVGVRDWFIRYLDKLVTPCGVRDFGNAPYYENDHRGLYYDIQLISLALFTGNQSLAVRIAHESVPRMIGHMHKFDRAVESVGTGTAAADCGEEDLVFALQGWTTLARIVSNGLGIHLWEKLSLKRSLRDEDDSRSTKKKKNNTKDQPFLCRAPEYAILLSQQDRTSCITTTTTTTAHDDSPEGSSPRRKFMNKEDDDTRWLPIYLTAQHWDCPPPWKYSEDEPTHYSVEPMYGFSSVVEERYNDHGIAPFWNLGLA